VPTGGYGHDAAAVLPSMSRDAGNGAIDVFGFVFACTAGRHGDGGAGAGEGGAARERGRGGERRSAKATSAATSAKLLYST